MNGKVSNIAQFSSESGKNQTAVWLQVLYYNCIIDQSSNTAMTYSSIFQAILLQQ